jgi:hypothetical protein
MNEAVAFVETQIPASQTIVVDYESGIELSHYLCNEHQVVYDGLAPDALVFHCGNHRIISTGPDQWAFTPEILFKQLASLVERGDLEPGETVWVGQAGWVVSLDEDLRAKFPEFHNLRTQEFGNNIRLFSFAVGSRSSRQP